MPTVALAKPSSGQRNVLDKLSRWAGGDVRASWNSRNGTPTYLLRYQGYLTPPSLRDPETIAVDFLRAWRELMQLSDADIVNLQVDNKYSDMHNGVTHLLYQQYYRGIKVFQGIVGFNIDKQGRILTAGGEYDPGIDIATEPSLSPAEAAQIALSTIVPLQEFKPKAVMGPTGPDRAATLQPFNPSSRNPPFPLSFYPPAQAPSLNPIEARLVIFPMPWGHRHRLAWQVEIDAGRGAYFIMIDANSGQLLFRHNSAACAQAEGLVFEEHPDKGPQVLKFFGPNPPASPNGWLTGMETAGNNVIAQKDADLDLANIYRVNEGYYRPSATDQRFNYSFQNAWERSNGTNVDTDLDAAITNLFYVNNFIHDYLYNLGFTEEAGNFQEDNFGRGGVGGDPVIADAAKICPKPPSDYPNNFDSSMVYGPFSLSGATAARMTFKGWIRSQKGGDVLNWLASKDGFSWDGWQASGDSKGWIERSLDFSALPELGSLLGEPRVWIAFQFSSDDSGTDRGVFVDDIAIEKTTIGGKETILAQNFDAPRWDTRGWQFLSSKLCEWGRTNVNSYSSNLSANPVAWQLPGQIFVRPEGKSPRIFTRPYEPGFGASPAKRYADAAFDGELIIHEYGHGLSKRLVGGPNTVAVLNGIQSGAMGEGWSDWFAASIYNDSVIMEYVTGNPSTGVRRYALHSNPLTYGDLCNGPGGCEVHDDGEIWATTLWNLRATFIDVYGYESGKAKAEQLVMDGLKQLNLLTNPDMLQGRDALLQADLATYWGANFGVIWRAFAARGMGYSAKSEGDSDKVFPAFDLPPELRSSRARRRP
ncbi:MAG: M36 family metallopeptidase [Acidobacteria bacterium]|nr:M36 family metallopeptidase [Acidobacteriota bacterium]